MHTPQLLVLGMMLTYLHAFIHLYIHFFSVCVVCSITCVVYVLGIQACATELYLWVLGILNSGSYAYVADLQFPHTHLFL